MHGERQFENRDEAGRVLGERLRAYADRDDVIVLALPRGGVPVGYRVARILGAPLDVFLVRKLGVPGHEELAMGAIASSGVRVLNDEVLSYLSVDRKVLEGVTERELRELHRREKEYRGGRPPPDVRGKTAILVDDGLATGSTMRAAVQALKLLEPSRIVVAVPTAAPQTCEEFAVEVDEVVCAITPEPFYAVGAWYKDFSQTTDDEVRELLMDEGSDTAVESRVTVEVAQAEGGSTRLEGELIVPRRAQAVVIFAHGSGSSRHSPRNQYVARVIREAGIGTLLFDLLTEEEEQRDMWSGHLRFDIDLLAERLAGAADWLRRREETRRLRIGYFGASTGGAAALVAAARHPQGVGAIVSRGGRPDLAGEALPSVQAPTLLLVGGEDHVVLELNRQALEALPEGLIKRLQVVPGATHLFEEPGALEQVARHARNWFELHLTEPR